MARSSWKIPYTLARLDRTMSQMKSPDKGLVIVYKRASTITPLFINQTVRIFNGVRQIPLKITEQHVGFKFGAFALTKKRVVPPKIKKKKRN
jgi:small subunit ribosomal protein S19